MIAKHMDRIIRSMQWPAAYLLAALSPWFVATLVLWLSRSPTYPLYSTMFCLGALATVALYRTGWVSPRILKIAIQMERRITRALLSLLLLEPTSTILGWVKSKLGIQKKIALDLNPPTAWLSDDNWLIRATPYFLPTASIVLWLLSALFLPAFLRSLVLGIGVSYHLLSVYIQFRVPDSANSPSGLPRRFWWLFLVPMNLLVFVTGYAFALEGFWGLQLVIADLTWPARALWTQLKSLIIHQ